METNLRLQCPSPPPDFVRDGDLNLRPSGSQPGDPLRMERLWRISVYFHRLSGGRYLSVPELKAGQRSIRGARLAVQIVPPWSHGDLCFSFSHWLTGHHVGVLQLFVRETGRHRRYSSALWSRTGGHGWRHTQVTLATHSVDKVLLKAERWTGLMAVDDVTLRRGACR
ncbi:nephronectin-like [Etheostoma cragini]|uniref:nephronectin-like n=1 Tax=Etheostoma cragini TaxID=417921 RepID=UPI00155F1188|nr:nephronectin-like [Etheostoma cragini]